MASLGARCLSWPSQHSISQQRQPIPSAARPLRPGPSLCRAVHRRVCCHAAASDQKNASEPMSLRDLIMFESDIESSSAISSDIDYPGSSADVAAGQQGEGGDPTMRAQEIINRATEVLAAARAALGTDAAPDSSGSSGPGRAAGSAAAVLERPPPPPAAAAPAGPPSSSRQAGGPQGGSSGSSGPAAPGSSGSNVSSPGGSSDGGGEALTRRWSPLAEDQDLTRHVLQNALDQMQASGAPIAAPKDEEEEIQAPTRGPASSSSSSSSSGLQPPSSSGRGGAGGGSSSTGGSSSRSSRDIRSGRTGVGLLSEDGHGPAPSWAQLLLGSDDFGGSGYSFPTSGPSGGSPAATVLEPQRQLQQAADRPSAWGWAVEEAEPLRLPPAALGLLSQEAIDAERARQAVLPPLQSVLELTTAFRPPERSGGVAVAAPVVTEAAVEGAVAAEPVGRTLPDGSGRLADGTWWEKKSGIEKGKNGYWKRWQTLKGGNAEGTLDWEETWWEASDYTGLKEMGARKEGRNTDGSAWRETWSERLMYASSNLDTVVERNAHKWAVDPSGDEWEEKWGEHYHQSGKVAKYADKWGKAGPNVWHERWGEDYDAGGDACVKWTDKWAERLLPGGAREQWGDKWHEAFANGRGEKNGEVWSVGASGERYQRWWGEQHLGDRNVRRHGHSTTGENWDDTIHMDTYYNPVPHFGFKHALSHSPQLCSVPLQPKTINELDPFGPGLDDF